MLIRANTSNMLKTVNLTDHSTESERNVGSRGMRRGSNRHLSSDLIRQLGNDFDEDDEFEEEEEGRLRRHTD